MATAERLQSGLFRGVYRDAKGKKCHTKAPHYEKKRDAKARANELEVESRRDASHAPGSTSASITWGEWWDRIAVKRREAQSETPLVEHYIVKNHLRPRWGAVPLIDITQADVQGWVDEMKEGKAPAYAQRIYSVFSVSISVAMKPENKVLLTSPCAGIVLPKIAKRSKKYMTPEHGVTLRSILSEEYADAVEFDLEVGLRPGELGGLHFSSVDLESGWVDVQNVVIGGRTKMLPRLIRPWPKDKDARRIPLTDKAIDIVKRKIKGRDMSKGCGIPHGDGSLCESELVFRTPNGLAIIPSTLERTLNRAFKNAGLAGRSPYSARRGWATRLAGGGVNAFDLTVWGGWADLRQAQEYVQQTPAARAKFRAAMGEQDPLKVITGSGTPAGTESDPAVSEGVQVEQRDTAV